MLPLALYFHITSLYTKFLKSSWYSEAKVVKIINHLYKLLESFPIHYSGVPLLFSKFKAKMETTTCQEMKTGVISPNIQFICILSTILLVSAQELLFPWCHFFPPNKWMYQWIWYHPVFWWYSANRHSNLVGSAKIYNKNCQWLNGSYGSIWQNSFLYHKKWALFLWRSWTAYPCCS